jgi:sulfur carrier protein ThiS
MTITIETHGMLCQLIPPGTTVCDVQTVGEAIERLGLPRLPGLILMVNDRLAGWPTALRDGDVLQLLPAVGGGVDTHPTKEMLQ